MENVSSCLCLHKSLIFRIFTVSSCTTKQFDKLATKVLEIWKNVPDVHYFAQIMIVLNKNVIFCFVFSQVVQKQMLGEVGN